MNHDAVKFKTDFHALEINPRGLGSAPNVYVNQLSIRMEFEKTGKEIKIREEILNYSRCTLKIHSRYYLTCFNST